MGSRWRKRLEDLSLDLNDTEVRSTTKQRAVASAEAFLSGYFGDVKNNIENENEVWELKDDPDIEKDNELLRFYDNCPKYEEEVEKNDETYEERDIFLKSKSFKELAQRVANKTGVSIKPSNIDIIWQICR